MQTRKRTSECGKEMTDDVECLPRLCNSSEYCVQIVVMARISSLIDV